MLSNQLEFFKDTDPRMINHTAGELSRIFFHTLCTGEYRSYTAQKINKIFEEDHNIDSLQERMIIMMHYLQTGYHNDHYPHKAGEYEHAATEYPERYEALLHGLSDNTLEKIKTVDTSLFSPHYPTDLGKKFYQDIHRDRQETPFRNMQKPRPFTPEAA